MTAPVWGTVMVTGHRPKDIPRDTHGWVRDKLALGVAWLRDERGMTIGVTGMALGVDMWWADALARAGMPFVAHIPYPQQPDPWRRNPQAVAEWERLRALADRDREVVYGDLAGLAEHARKRVAVKLLHRRNDGMLDAVTPDGAVVAAWCPSKRDGGTYSAVSKAHQRRLPVIHINPEARTVTVPSRARLAHLLNPTAPEPLIPA
ncbi:hypothetical protein AB0L22_08845 [Micromonospora haikouensis]|uniref:hypothetical protein n=1 Tax=Micromonospora haikouensis TaxID=686309 RepID=UPI0034310CFF